MIGLGLGAGATAIWAAVELLPLALVAGGIYLAYRAVSPPISPSQDKQENQ